MMFNIDIDNYIIYHGKYVYDVIYINVCSSMIEKLKLHE